MDSPAAPSIASQPTGTPHDSSATSTPRLPAMQTTPPAVQASLVPSKDSAEFSLAYSSDVTGGTEEAPEKADVASIGEMTDKLSQLSNRLEKDTDHTETKGTIAKLMRRVRPMIHGRFMAFLAIANLVLFILIILALIVFVVLGSLTLYYYFGVYKKIAVNDEQCAVIWDGWSECTANCTDRKTKNASSEVPTRTRKALAVYGTKGGCDGLTNVEDKIYCNLHSCSVYKPEESTTTTMTT